MRTCPITNQDCGCTGMCLLAVADASPMQDAPTRTETYLIGAEAEQAKFESWWAKHQPDAVQKFGETGASHLKAMALLGWMGKASEEK